jgi:hypothetical protein
VTCAFFALALGVHLGVVRNLARVLLSVAFNFMKLAFNLIFQGRYHLFSATFSSKTFHESNLNVRIAEMIFDVSLAVLLCLLLRGQMVRLINVMAGLLVESGTGEFGRLPAVASRLFIVLRYRVVALGAWHGDRKIRLFGVPRIN